jgi:hypothetical protein
MTDILPAPDTFSHEHHALMAALVFVRFGRDHEAARAAWSRLLQNQGWDDDAAGREEWVRMVQTGLRFLRSAGGEPR